MHSPFAFLDRPSSVPTLLDAEAEREWSGDELAAAVNAEAERMLTGRRELVFCLCTQSVASVIGYLSAVRAGHAVALLDGSVGEELTGRLLERYRPAFVLRPGEGSTLLIESCDRRPPTEVPPELAVLLSTSGTTGSPRLVRLSRRNIDANATAIAEYLEIDERERAIQSLPIHYSYGLSVLNSHLAAGASLIVSPHNIVQREFWADADRWQATSFAGVPHSYAILERAGLLRSSMPDSMLTLTQAGGRLPPAAVIELHDLTQERGGRFWVMYGQTEATARISYVPPDALPDKAHTVGIPIPGGRLSVRTEDDEVAEPHREGELVYEGPNVMLGYAQGSGDLALGDQLNGVLRTGDLGTRDEDGFFQLTSRLKRIAKIYGLRVNLDEIEAEAAACSPEPIAAVDGGEQILLFRLAGSQTPADDLCQTLASHFGLRSRAFAVRDLEELPLRSSGKVDYDSLASQHAS